MSHSSFLLAQTSHLLIRCRENLQTLSETHISSSEETTMDYEIDLHDTTDSDQGERIPVPKPVIAGS